MFLYFLYLCFCQFYLYFTTCCMKLLDVVSTIYFKVNFSRLFVIHTIYSVPKNESLLYCTEVKVLFLIRKITLFYHK